MRVFISHSSKDKKLINEIYSFLVDDLRIERKDIYCTSQNSISAGENFISSIRDNLSNSSIVLFIITENYMKSNFCIMEMGAAWAIKNNIIPIIIPPLDYTILESTPLQSVQSVMIDNIDGLISIFGKKFYDSGIINEVDSDLKSKTINLINNLNCHEMYSDMYLKKNKSNKRPINDINEKIHNLYVEKKNILEKRAESGDEKSQYILAYNYFQGNLGFEVNYSEAYKWVNMSVSAEFIPAYDLLGKMYYRGTGVKQSFKESLFWYKKAADNDYISSCGHIAFMYSIGLGDKRNIPLAEFYYKKAIELGGDYYDSLGNMYYSFGNMTKALECFSKVKSEFASSFHRVGDILYYGYENNETDYEQAATFYRKAAELGVTEAKHQLGNIYYYGHFGHEFELAAYWYKEAANEGYSLSQYVLGYLYEYGLGINKDDDEAIYWFEKSAKQGYYLSQWHLGNLYFRGTLSIKPNPDKAFEWIKKAALQGFHEAQRMLGDLYFHGFGCMKDKVEAHKWYKMSYDQGDELAIIAIKDKLI